MTCGIICRREIDNVPVSARRIHYDEPKLDPFERWLFLGFGIACIIAGLAILGLLTYGVITTVAAAVS